MDMSSWFLPVNRKMALYGSSLTVGWGLVFCVFSLLWASERLDGVSADPGSVPAVSTTMAVHGGIIDGYGVGGVEVDSQNQPVQVAKEQAIFVAYRHAFHLLIDHMTGGASPHVTGVAAALTNDDLDALVRDFEIEWEKQSAFSYRASFFVRFKEGAVRRYLDQDLSKNLGEKVAYRAPKTSAVLLPVHTVGDHYGLWDDGNGWFGFLNTLDTFDDKSFVLPLGDLQDRSLLPAADVVLGDGRLHGIMDRYGVDRALIARLDGGPDARGHGVLRLFYVMKNQGVVSMETQSIVPQQGQSIYVGAYDALQESYGRFLQGGQRVGEKHTLRAIVSFDDLETWHQIQNRLRALPLIKDVSVDTLSTRSAHVHITHVGDDRSLLALAQEGGIAFNQVGTEWIIEQVDHRPDGT